MGDASPAHDRPAKRQKTDYPLLVEYAKSGRAKCSDPHCCVPESGNLIAKGEIRIGSRFDMPGRDTPNCSWYHAECRLLSVQRRATARTKRVCALQDLEGWELLEEAHQQWLEDIIADANDPDYDLLQNQARGAVPNKDKNAEERVPGQPNPNQPNRVGGGRAAGGPRGNRKETDAERRKRKRLEDPDRYDLRGLRMGQNKIMAAEMEVGEDVFPIWRKDADGDWYKVFSDRAHRAKTGVNKELSYKMQQIVASKKERAERNEGLSCKTCEQRGHKWGPQCPLYTRQDRKEFDQFLVSKHTCFLCGAVGHYASDCPEANITAEMCEEC